MSSWTEKLTNFHSSSQICVAYRKVSLAADIFISIVYISSILWTVGVLRENI